MCIRDSNEDSKPEKWLSNLPQFLHHYVEGMTLSRQQVRRKTKFPDFFAMIKRTFHPFWKFVFDPTLKRQISASSGRGHLWPQSKRIQWWKKVQEKYNHFRENRGKSFFFGEISPSTVGWKLSKRKVVSYMGARALHARDSIMSIFEKKFSNVSRFRALSMTSLILGGN